MPAPNDSILVPLRLSRALTCARTRRFEPVSCGLPFPRGLVSDAEHIGLRDRAGEPLAVQVRPLDRWDDGSLRWALLDFQLTLEDSSDDGSVVHVEIGPTAGSGSVIAPSLTVTEISSGLKVDTGCAVFRFERGAGFPFSSVTLSDGTSLCGEESGLQIELVDAAPALFEITDIRVEDSGPLRAELRIDGRARGRSSGLVVSARVEVFAQSATAEIEIVTHNPHRAEHSGGIWLLGDSGSIMIREATLRLDLEHPVQQVSYTVDPSDGLRRGAAPFEIHQESSGGDFWNGPIHKNRHGDVPFKFRGYEINGDGAIERGSRATPVVQVHAGKSEITIAVPKFWQNFPRSITVNGSQVAVGLFPRRSEPHELQGGERKTHRLTIAFSSDKVCDLPLAWVHDPVALAASPEWYCDAQATPFLRPASQDTNQSYLSLVDLALDSDRGFMAKRERADEYGWRNFGDLPADHESAYLPPGQSHVSHYNNQYDAVAAFATHFFRTGDERWRELMDDLVVHVRDIDIYHTSEDKPAYNGGMFWHTQHYLDADTSTHRTYPKGTHGGGPSAEHNYATGLMLHYFLTGDRTSREEAIGLARWVINMDDGTLTPFRWLSRSATGFASATGSLDYQGPGRGAANSILACLAAHRLSGQAEYLAKAEQLVRRCIHPTDDIEARKLFDVERRWYYTVFLQALGQYLSHKEDLGAVDDMHGYAAASLVHYARWIAAHEEPYLNHPERLEFPNDTWTAQDLRKAEALLWAARYVSSEERAQFLTRAEEFKRFSVDRLRSTSYGSLTRPLILTLANGATGAAVTAAGAVADSPRGSAGYPPIDAFIPQRYRAVRNAKRLALAFVGFILVAIWVLA